MPDLFCRHFAFHTSLKRAAPRTTRYYELYRNAAELSLMKYFLPDPSRGRASRALVIVLAAFQGSLDDDILLIILNLVCTGSAADGKPMRSIRRASKTPPRAKPGKAVQYTTGLAGVVRDAALATGIVPLAGLCDLSLAIISILQNTRFQKKRSLRLVEQIHQLLSALGGVWYADKHLQSPNVMAAVGQYAR
ncbi:hypothetical protein C8R47DRAFT_747835 [Mycena vitilis]|nr:hypothetical protein C8R47DRAFT_747835 [Mycena vitilis]